MENDKSFHSQICFNIYYLQKFYLNEKLNFKAKIVCEKQIRLSNLFVSFTILRLFYKIRKSGSPE